MIHPISEYQFFNCNSIADIIVRTPDSPFQFSMNYFDQIQYLSEFVNINAIKIDSQKNSKITISNILNNIGSDEMSITTHLKILDNAQGNLIDIDAGGIHLDINYNDSIEVYVDGALEYKSDDLITKDFFIVVNASKNKGFEVIINLSSPIVHEIVLPSFNFITIGDIELGDMAIANLKIFDKKIYELDMVNYSNLLISDLFFKNGSTSLSYVNLLQNTLVQPVFDSTDIVVTATNHVDAEKSASSIQNFDITPLNEAGITYLNEVGVKFQSVEDFIFEDGKNYCCWILVNNVEQLEFKFTDTNYYDYIFKIYNTSGWYLLGKLISYADVVGNELSFGINADGSTASYSFTLTEQEGNYHDTSPKISIIDSVVSNGRIGTTINLSIGGFNIVEANYYPTDINFNTNSETLSLDTFIVKDIMKTNVPNLISNIDKCIVQRDRYLNTDVLYLSDTNSSIYVENRLFAPFSSAKISIVAVFKLDEVLCNSIETIKLFENLFNYDIILKSDGEYVLKVMNGVVLIASIDYSLIKNTLIMVSIIKTDDNTVIKLNDLSVIVPNIDMHFTGRKYFDSFVNFAGKIIDLKIYYSELSESTLGAIASSYMVGNDEKFFLRSKDNILRSISSAVSTLSVKLNEYFVCAYIDSGNTWLYTYKLEGIEMSEVFNVMIPNVVAIKLAHVTKNIFIIVTSESCILYQVQKNNSFSIHAIIDTSNDKRFIDIICIDNTLGEYYIIYEDDIKNLYYYLFRISEVNILTKDTLDDSAVYNEIVAYYYSQENLGLYMPYDYTLDIASEEGTSGLNYTLSTMDANAYDKANLNRSGLNKIKGDDQ